MFLWLLTPDVLSTFSSVILRKADEMIQNVHVFRNKDIVKQRKNYLRAGTFFVFFKCVPEQHLHIVTTCSMTEKRQASLAIPFTMPTVKFKANHKFKANQNHYHYMTSLPGSLSHQMRIFILLTAHFFIYRVPSDPRRTRRSSQNGTKPGYLHGINKIRMILFPLFVIGLKYLNSPWMGYYTCS